MHHCSRSLPLKSGKSHVNRGWARIRRTEEGSRQSDRARRDPDFFLPNSAPSAIRVHSRRAGIKFDVRLCVPDGLTSVCDDQIVYNETNKSVAVSLSRERVVSMLQ